MDKANVLKIAIPFYAIRDNKGNEYYGENHFSRYYIKSPRFIVFVYKRDLGFTATPLSGYRPLNLALGRDDYISELKYILSMLNQKKDEKAFHISTKDIAKYILGFLVGFNRNKPLIKSDSYIIEINNAKYYAEKILELEPNIVLRVENIRWLNLSIFLNTVENRSIETWIVENNDTKRERYRILEFILEDRREARSEIEGILQER